MSALDWMGGALAASTLLMLAVLLLRGHVARLFGAKIAYALWLLPALRMILPPIPGEWALFGSNMVFDPPRMIAVAPLSAAIAAPTPLPMAVPAAVPMAAAAPIDWFSIALWAWALGAAGYFAFQIICYRLFIGRALRDATLLTRAAGISVYQSPHVMSPMAAGVIHRRILLPADFTQRFAPEERRLALAHETAHHCRGDLVANLAALALLSLHWFNPLAHWAYRAFRDDQETACDATVLDAESADRRHAYGSAILKSATCRVPGAACALNHAGALKRRISIMIDGRKSRTMRLGGGALALALVAGGLIGTATVAATAGESDTRIVRDTPHDTRITVIENGRIRAATPAERREAIRAARAAGEAAREAGRAAERALRDAERSLAQVQAPIPPMPPIPPVPPVPPLPTTAIAPVAPVPPVPPLPPIATEAYRGPVVIRNGGHTVIVSNRDHAVVDRRAIRAQVDAAMAEARAAIAEGGRERERAMAEAGRERTLALREASRARIEALAESRHAREAALAEAARARAEALAEIERWDDR